MAAAVTLGPPLSHLFREAMEVLGAFVRENDVRLSRDGLFAEAPIGPADRAAPRQ